MLIQPTATTGDILKNLPVFILSSSLNDRQTIFKSLIQLVNDKDIEETTIRGLFKVIIKTHIRYNDLKSIAIVNQFVAHLLKKYPAIGSKNLVLCLHGYCQPLKQLNSTKSISRVYLSALKLSACIDWNQCGDDNDVKSKLIECQAILCTLVTNVDSQKITDKVYQKLKTFWSRTPIEEYLNLLRQLSVNSANTDPSIALHLAILWDFIIKYLSELKSNDLIAKHKSIFSELFLKQIIGSKTKLSDQLIANGFRYQLKQITHEDFSKSFWPSIQKAVLRNAEVVLNLVSVIFKGLSLDLSPYAIDIGKLLATQLHSKDDTLRLEAISATKYLAQQCSNSSAIEGLLKHYFAVLNGSEGKLTIAVQRFGVVSGIGSLSYHSVSGEAQHLSELAMESFVTVLKQEVHEPTIIHMTAQLQLWCQRLVTEIPKLFIDWFKALQTLKTSTANVKSAYILCLSSAFKQNMSEQGNDVLTILTNSAQKSFTSTVSQLPNLTEGLYAICLLQKLFTFNKQYETKVKTLFNQMFETKKFVFLTDKFINVANEESLQTLILFIDSLVFNYETKLDSKMDPINKALLLLMTHPISYSVRKQALTTTKKLATNSINDKFIIDLLKQYYQLFKDLKDVQSDSKQQTGDENQQNSDVTKQPTVSALIECHNSLLTYYSDDHNLKQILLVALYSSHINPIFKTNSNLWCNLLHKRIDAKSVDKYFKENTDTIVHTVLREIDDNCVKSNAISALVRIAPHQFIPIFLEKAVNTLSLPDFKIITQMDYEIYLTPEGELYDKSMVDTMQNDFQNNKNVKRESKLYSYKDQMEEIELRKELEAKKKAQGDIKGPQLSKKQLEMKEQQLEKEAQIRAKIQSNFNEFNTAIDLIDTIANSNPKDLSIYINDVLFALINLFASPLCTQIATKLFTDLRKALFNQKDYDLKKFGDSLAFITLRQLKPLCPIDDNWMAGVLDERVDNLMTQLYKRTCRPTGRDYDEKTAQLAIKLRLTAPAFAYSFPLIQSLLLSPDTSEELLLHCLQIVSEHSQMRFTFHLDDDEMEILKDPRYLPIKYMFLTILKVIAKSPIHIEQNASKVLTDIAMAASGGKGCAKASFDEVMTLLEALKSSSEVVRSSALSALEVLTDNVLVNINDEKQRFILMHRIFVAQFDPNESCSTSAQKLFGDCCLRTRVSLSDALIDDIVSGNSVIRHSVAGAMEALLSEFPEESLKVIKNLINLYKEKAKVLPPLVDSFGRTLANSQVDIYEPRLGVALLLTQIAPLIPNEAIKEIAHFFIPEALGDRNESVQTQMLEAGCALVNLHGKDNITLLLNVFEKFLDEAANTSDNDVVRRSVVVLMGTLARHIDKDNPKVKPIVAKLIEALSTPSQMVQEAVANCLPYLIPAFKEEAPSLLQKLLQLLLESESYGERKGAAYGIAGIIKGLGILSLKQLGIMDTLTEAIQDKKNPNHREGALFAFEMLCSMLGRLFEPYIVHILPHLLLCFGDTSTRVRQATDDTSKQVMSKLSAHGVKLVLPSLLNALEEDSWRTKAGSIELLGAMAFCAPKQLSSCLPSIVPKLMIVISDSHPKVQNTAAQALKQIGSVIRNPEIQAIVPVLLEALQDPANKTSKCLNTMLNTKFVHFIDAPSLALIMPVVERAFQGRSTETRKMAAQIIGNMYALTDQKDLSPYLPSIIPGLKQSLLDPVPEVRGVTARALGAMVKGMGEDIFDDLMPWLMSTLTSETSSVDRSGAAQGLSEVMGGLGLERLEKFIPEIIETSERIDIAPHVKDGYIMLFIYLPMVFTQDFTIYIGRIINPVLKALADENEFVRETALRAGQRIVNMYAETAIQLLLPELEAGLFDENWRIRFSSVQLLGDLLFKISGVTGKMTTETADEDDNFGTEQSHRAIMYALGGNRRNRVLSGLYMGRSDVSLQVRQAALHVWKVVVTNTPRTLKEILPTLFSLLLGCLASNSTDKQTVAGRTLGDLVRKLGERILPEIIPILEQGLESDRSDQRQGVCIGLSEIMASTSKEMVQAFVDSLVPTVKKALCDPLPEVRQAAAKTFDSLHSAVGVRALEEILPALLHQLGDPEKGEFILDGLRQVMAIKSRVVLPYLVPQLTVAPVNTRALSFLSTVAGDSLSKHLPKILPALLLALSNAIDTPNEKQEFDYCQSVILSVNDELGARTIVDHLLESARNESSTIRRSSVLLLYAYCSSPKANISANTSQLIRGLILLFTDSNEQVLNQSWEALNAITKALESKEQMEYVQEVRQAVRHAVSGLKNANNGTNQLLLPGFCLAKGIAPILPIFREAILNGNPEQKEQAANGLSEVIELTSAEALKPSVVNIAGPLIRILGDRFTWNVKVAVLNTLSLLLSKVGVLLRPFIPQLQQTFLKALSDGHRSVRLKAANALSQLIIVHNRCDPVFTELHNVIKSSGSSDDWAMKDTTLHALRLCITPAGDKMSDTVRRQLTATIISQLGLPDDSCRSTAASCLGVLCAWLPNDELNSIAKEHLLDDDMTVDWTLRHGRSVALRIALKEAFNRLVKDEWIDRISKTLLAFMTSDRVPIVINGIKGSAYLIKEYLAKSEVPPQTIVTAFARGMNHSSNEVKQTVASSTIFIAKCSTPSSIPVILFKSLIPLLVNGTKEKNTIVRANSEHALVAFLRLRSGDEVLQSCMAALDSGAVESLQDCINKTLKKVAQQQHEPKEEEFDDTLFT